MTNMADKVTEHLNYAAGEIQTAIYGDMDANPLHRVASFSELGLFLERELRREVKHARDMGETWTAIGITLGVSRQAAQQRFSE